MGGQSWRFRKKSSLRWKPGSRQAGTIWYNWIPVFAGMTRNGAFRLFTELSKLKLTKII